MALLHQKPTVYHNSTCTLHNSSCSLRNCSLHIVKRILIKHISSLKACHSLALQLIGLLQLVFFSEKSFWESLWQTASLCDWTTYSCNLWQKINDISFKIRAFWKQSGLWKAVLSLPVFILVSGWPLGSFYRLASVSHQQKHQGGFDTLIAFSTVILHKCVCVYVWMFWQGEIGVCMCLCV